MICFRGLPAAALSLVLLLASCDDGSGPSVVPTTLALTETSLTLAEGDTARLWVSVRDQSGELVQGPPVTWSVSDPSVVAIDATGGLSARAQGEAYAVATLSRRGGPSLRDSARVQVYPLAGSIRLIDDPREPRVAGGQTLRAPVRFRVLDRGGRPATDVTVTFAVASGGGAVSPASARTDSLGIASTSFTLGPGAGYHLFTAAARGTEPAAFAISAAEIATLTLSPDSAVIPAPGCGSGFRATLRTGSGAEATGRIVDFRVGDPGVVELSTPLIPGTYREQSRLVAGKKVGETTLIATYDGVADTAKVRVLPERPTRVVISFAPDDTVRVVRGDSAGATARVFGGCGATLDEPVAYTSLAPQIASVDAKGIVLGLADGYAPIVARSGDLADTVVAHVRTFVLLPRDTTVRVGETVQYQVMTAGPGGALLPFAGAAYHVAASPHLSVTRTGERLFTAHAVGEASVYAYTHPPASGWYVRGAKLRVVAPAAQRGRTR